MYHELSDEMFQEFKKHCEKEGIKYDTDSDYRALNHTLNFLTAFCLTVVLTTFNQTTYYARPNFH